MIQINSNQVTQGLKSLFDINQPTGVRCLAVLEGGNAGRILTDDAEHPNWVLVWERDDGCLYRGGKVDAQVLARGVELLRQEDTVALGYREGEDMEQLLPATPDASATCLEFDRCLGSRDLSGLVNNLPKGYTLQRMDCTLLENSPHYGGTLRRYGNIENFLQHGIAVCIKEGERTVCEVYADMEVLGVRELGVTTQAAYRKQGFATTACAYIIQLCEQAGSSTYWDCVETNHASVALARKLGFSNMRRYHLVAWFKLNNS